MMWVEFLDKLNKEIAKALADRAGTKYVASYSMTNPELEQGYTDATTLYVAGALLQQMLAAFPDQPTFLLFVTTRPFENGRVIELRGYKLAKG